MITAHGALYYWKTGWAALYTPQMLVANEEKMVSRSDAGHRHYSKPLLAGVTGLIVVVAMALLVGSAELIARFLEPRAMEHANVNQPDPVLGSDSPARNVAECYSGIHQCVDHQLLDDGRPRSY